MKTKNAGFSLFFSKKMLFFEKKLILARKIKWKHLNAIMTPLW